MDKSKICLAAGIASMMTMICLTFGNWMAWLIPHIMAKSSALVDIIFVVWQIVLVMILWLLCICKIEVAILFLILASEITRIVLRFEKYLSKILLSLFQRAALALVSLWFTIWKRKQSGNMSTN